MGSDEKVMLRFLQPRSGDLSLARRFNAGRGTGACTYRGLKTTAKINCRSATKKRTEPYLFITPKK
jgi:hypothetical protein